LVERDFKHPYLLNYLKLHPRNSNMSIFLHFSPLPYLLSTNGLVLLGPRVWFK
jgi:hypothetical protein